MSATRQLHNVAIYLGFSIATSAIGLGSVMVMTRLIPPSEYGLIGVFFSLLFFVAPMVSLSADGLIAVNKSTLDADHYRTFQQTYIFIAYVGFAVLQLLFIGALAAGAYRDPLLAGTPLFGLVRFLAGMAGTEYVVEQRPVTFGLMSVATTLFSLLMTVVLIKLFGPWGGFRVIAMFTADLLMLGVRYWGRLTLLLQPIWDRKVGAQLIRFGLPSLAAVAGAWALNESDKIVVAREAGMHAAGIYSAAAGLAVIMVTFNQSLTNALYPDMFRQMAARPHSMRSILLRHCASFVGFTSAFALAVLGAYFLFGNLLLPPRYLGGRAVFVCLVLTGIAISVYRPFGLAADYLRMGRIRAMAITLGGIVTIVVADLGVRHGSLLWAPAGIACGYLCAAFVLLSAIRWQQERLP